MQPAYSNAMDFKQRDAELVIAAQQGNDEAFTALFSAHRLKTFAICFRMTKSFAEAEDLTQEVFLLVYRKLASFRHNSEFATWLHRVTVNVVLMHFRKRSLRSISLDTLMNPATSELPREFGKDDPDLDGAVDRIALRRAMKDLPVGYRQVFMLHDVEGYEHRDIARLLRCSIGNSKSQLHKARVKMRDLLGLDKPVRTWRRNASKGRAECSRGDIYATGSGWRALCA